MSNHSSIRSLSISPPIPTENSQISARNMRLWRRQTMGLEESAVPSTNLQHYAERVAILESNHSRMVHELDLTRDALESARTEAAVAHRYSLASMPAHRTTSHATSERDREEDILVPELLETIRGLRAHITKLTSSLDARTEQLSSVTSALEYEREDRMMCDQQMETLRRENFVLLEHNKLLAGRDAALQEGISTLLTKSQADDWMRGILEAELRQARSDSASDKQCTPSLDGLKPASSRPVIGITIENIVPLRAQVVAAQDELHLTRKVLQESEQTCVELTRRFEAVQRSMSLCVDTSSRALETEREAHRERQSALLEENQALKAALHSLRSETAHTRPYIAHMSSHTAPCTSASKVHFESSEEENTSRRISIGPERRRRLSSLRSTSSSSTNPPDSAITLIAPSPIDSSAGLRPTLPSYFKPFLSRATTTTEAKPHTAEQNKASLLESTIHKRQQTSAGLPRLKAEPTHFIDVNVNPDLERPVTGHSERGGANQHDHRATALLAGLVKKHDCTAWEFV